MGRFELVSWSAGILERHLKRHEAIEQTRFAIEMTSAKATTISVLLPMFEEPKPQKGPKDLRLHRKGTRVPCLVQHPIDGDRA
jgi:hypothetical protein